MSTKIINVWSSPRNISTAFMYAWAQRDDFSVVDEPLYAHYLRVTDAEHPGKKEILESQQPHAVDVIRDVLLASYPTPWVLHKQMTHHLVDMDWSFMKKTYNVLLIRNPREIIASYSKVIPHPTMRDIGIKKQMDLYQYLKENNSLTAILDTNEILKNPEKIFQTLCAQLNIEFQESMLHWDAGARPEDGVWAKYWYANVHRSTGFAPYRAKDISLSEELELLALECMTYYEQLFEHCLKA